MLILISLSSPLMAKPSGEYVGGQMCSSCHQNQYQDWQHSDHAKAMSKATSSSVLGDFSDKTVNFHGVDSRFYKKDDKYWVDTQGKGGKPGSFEIKYTFGYEPLQQYLIELEDGHIQALNLAWDSRPKVLGGQRWYHLQPAEQINPDHPFHWTRYFQNWNTRCASCHSTNLQKNYNPVDHSYQTSWSEINVSCEACHGPGSKHVELAGNNQLTGENSGFDRRAGGRIGWQFVEGNPIAQPVGKPNNAEINTCGTCHSLRTNLDEQWQGKSYHDTQMIQLMTQPSYHVDGQISEEVFVLGSFLQSKMHEQGVTCTNCHNPHTGKTLVEGNGLCSQCHLPNVYDTPDHYQHPKDEAGSQCVDCHMPTTRYMGVDDRRDHSFVVPRANKLKKASVPTPCAACHQEGDAWIDDKLKSWPAKPVTENWARLNHKVQQGDVLVTQALVKSVTEGDMADIRKATLIGQTVTMPSRMSVEAAQQLLSHESPLVRRGAVSALSPLQPQDRWALLKGHINDPARNVRHEIAGNLADVLNMLPAAERAPLQALLDEYRAALLESQDAPSGQLALANLATNLGDNKGAEQAMLKALEIEPHFIPALLNMADFYRSTGESAKVSPLLEKAIEIGPDSAAAHHSYGLHLVREKKYGKSLKHLKLSTETQGTSARFYYVYAIALESQGKLNIAIDALKEANDRWSNQYDVILTLVQFLEKAGRTDEIIRYLSRLSAIAPNAPATRHFLQKYAG